MLARLSTKIISKKYTWYLNIHISRKKYFLLQDEKILPQLFGYRSTCAIWSLVRREVKI